MSTFLQSLGASVSGMFGFGFLDPGPEVKIQQKIGSVKDSINTMYQKGLLKYDEQNEKYKEIMMAFMDKRYELINLKIKYDEELEASQNQLANAHFLILATTMFITIIYVLHLPTKK